MSNTNTDILIVGAGLCGLMTATALQSTDRQITIVDKGRSVGGRLATRRIGPGRADHGAQFFTVRSPEFQAHVDHWLAADLAYRWSNGWTAGYRPNGNPITALDGYPRYAIRGGFNMLAKHLAAELSQPVSEAQHVDINVGVHLTAISATDSGWQAMDETGNGYTAHEIVITSPVPQTLALLEAGHVALAADDHAALTRIQYGPCLCGLFWVDGAVNLPEPGAMPRPGGIISWIADNQRKGISPEATLVTVHIDPAYSRDHYEEPDEVVFPPIEAAFAEYLVAGATVREAQLKHWRYAQPQVLHPERYLRATNLPPLYFGGDAFQEPRVEGAARSGLALGEALKKT